MRKIKATIFLTAALFVIFSLYGITASAQENTSVPSIWLPRSLSPAFVEPGGAFDVEIESGYDLSNADYTVKLHNDLRYWDAEIIKIVKDKVRYGIRDGYIITIKVPENIPPELFSIVFTDKSGFSIGSARSVKVETYFEEDFYILQISDEHVAPGEPTFEDGRNGEKTTSVQIKYWSQSVINLINPRLVIYSGDNTHTYSNATKWLGMEAARKNLLEYRNALQGYTVATAAVAGNHDVGWSNDYVNRLEWGSVWENIIGARAFPIKMGSFFIMCSEYSLKDYFTYAVNQYNKYFNDPTTGFSLIATHFYEDNASFTPVANGTNPCDLMIVGHNHVTKALESPYYPVYSTATAKSYNRAGYFEFKKNNDKWFCPQIENRQPGDVFKLWGSYGSSPVVREKFKKVNNGTVDENEVYITNDLDKNFYNGRVRFLMEKGVYEVEGGTILSQYDYGINHTAVVVKVNIKALSTTVVNIIEKVEEQLEFVSGDVDQDGRITVKDAIMVVQSISGKLDLSISQQSIADINKDNNITLADAVLIFQKAARLIGAGKI